jgi:anti-sigma28 factor (negative regulator of flagellin synthesis)
MDRIDIQGTNGIAARLRARASAPVGPTDRPDPVPAESDQAAAAALSAVGLAGAEAPIDQERVGRIRHAIAQGQYLLEPRKTADAIIASGFMLRNAQ